MTDFFKKYGGRLKSIALVLMLIIPFFLYQSAVNGSNLQTNFFLGLMMINMLFVMMKG